MGDEQILHLFLHCLTNSPKRPGKAITFNTATVSHLNFMPTQNYALYIEFKKLTLGPVFTLVLQDRHDKYPQKSWRLAKRLAQTTFLDGLNLKSTSKRGNQTKVENKKSKFSCTQVH